MDPQGLSFLGKVRALTAMGRIPLASEVPVWTLLGAVLSSQIFDSSRAPAAVTGSPSIFRTFDWVTSLQCMFITWASNISINYSNEYFDWDVDRPSQLAAIRKDVQDRKDAISGVRDANLESKLDGKEGQASKVNGGIMAKHNDNTAEVQRLKTKGEIMTKISGNTTRIIHDGTFPPYAALLCAGAWQLAVFSVIVFSRLNSPSSPFRGLALQITWIGTFFSQEYIAPPFRFHYHALGEFTSAFLMVPLDILFGMCAHYTATNNRPLHWRELPLLLDAQIWNFLVAVYLFEQARILVMHIPDIEGDIRGRKFTLCTRLGHKGSSQLHGLLNLSCTTAFGILIAQLYADKAGKGLLNRVAGGLPLLTQAGLDAHRGTLLAGLAFIALYYLPISATVYTSLIAASEDQEKSPNKGLLPKLHPTTCAIVVSLQLLITPWLLTGTILLAGRAGLKHG